MQYIYCPERRKVEKNKVDPIFSSRPASAGRGFLGLVVVDV